VTDSEWIAVAALAQVAAAAIALGGLCFVGWQIRAGRKTADLQSLQDFYRSATEREHAFLRATDDGERLQAFHEFLNFLELYALAHNKRLLPDASREFVKDKLCDSIAEIEIMPSWHPQLLTAITSAKTFIELSRFYKRNRAEIK
jgi:hypothetical protein